jgi:hypothetical protein
VEDSSITRDCSSMMEYFVLSRMARWDFRSRARLRARSSGVGA